MDMAHNRNNYRKLALACGIFAAATNGLHAQEASLIPDLVEINPGNHAHRMSGEFLKHGYPVDAPQVDIHFARSLHIMKYQVSNNDYSRCVAENACGLPFKLKQAVADNKPVTGVSFIDAKNYAQWLSGKTGINWRLPSDAEWAYAAGSRFYDDALGGDGGESENGESASDPSRRGLLKYQQAIDLDRNPDSSVRERGAHGANENGVFDQSGNVWEWTDTCYKRSGISATGELIDADTGNCGVRVVEGKHRAYMTIFIQDAKSGGCAVGAPPDYLGFRLVRDNSSFFSVQRMRNWWTSMTSG
jgi:formylglycine-generating enzyme required for sulfatase activity